MTRKARRQRGFCHSFLASAPCLPACLKRQCHARPSSLHPPTPQAAPRPTPMFFIPALCPPPTHTHTFAPPFPLPPLSLRRGMVCCAGEGLPCAQPAAGDGDDAGGGAAGSGAGHDAAGQGQPGSKVRAQERALKPASGPSPLGRLPPAGPRCVLAAHQQGGGVAGWFPVRRQLGIRCSRQGGRAYTCVAARPAGVGGGWGGGWVAEAGMRSAPSQGQVREYEPISLFTTLLTQLHATH